MNIERIMNVFRLPPKIMRIVIRVCFKFKALLMYARARSKRQMKLRLQTEADPYYKNEDGKMGRTLELKGKSIKPIPHDLYSLNDLTTLDMSASRESNLDCLLDKLPIELVFLKNLRCLHIDVNNIQIIPVEIGELVNLEKLTCANNRISCLPSSFKKLQKLTSLHLGNNSFEHFPNCICTLGNLKFLDFTNNELNLIPEDIGNLKLLEILLLFHNKLENLPDSLFTLKKLKTLWIGENQLKKLPHSIVNLRKLDWEETQLSSNVSGNPLVDPPLEICEKGIKNIGVYYRAIARRKSSLNHQNLSITEQNQKLLPKINEVRKASLRNFKFKSEIKPILKGKKLK